MTEKYATVCPHCKQPLYLTLTLSNEEGQKPADKKPDEYLPGRDVEQALEQFGELLDITPTEGKLLIWINTDTGTIEDKSTWVSIMKVVKAHGGVWVPGPSDQRHWEVPT